MTLSGNSYFHEIHVRIYAHVYFQPSVPALQRPAKPEPYSEHIRKREVRTHVRNLLLQRATLYIEDVSLPCRGPPALRLQERVVVSPSVVWMRLSTSPTTASTPPSPHLDYMVLCTCIYTRASRVCANY